MTTIGGTSRRGYPPRADRKSLCAESVTYVVGIIRHPCDRNRRAKVGLVDGCRLAEQREVRLRSYRRYGETAFMCGNSHLVRRPAKRADLAEARRSRAKAGLGHRSAEGAKVAPRAGLEPATLRLTAGCSAIELPRNRWEPGLYHGGHLDSDRTSLFVRTTYPIRRIQSELPSASAEPRYCQVAS